MMWLALGLTAFVGLLLVLEFLARLAVLRMIGDGYDDH